MAAVTWVTPVSVDPGAGSGWQDADCSAFISGSATGVIIEIVHGASLTRTGIRENGSTDDIDSDAWSSGVHMWGAIGVDGSGIIEVYRSVAGQDFILHGKDA